jgi:GrpB-like predicted nucleotidyltransferase (UPF0157 family)
VATHPLWRPFELTDLDVVVTVTVTMLPDKPIEVVPYDVGWPARYAQLDERVRRVLGDRVLDLQHVGSTAVSGLAAKPVIDGVLTVADPADESTYVPGLGADGFVLRVREPEWQEHRMLTMPDRSINLHVFGPGATEPRRQRLFRDWLRSHPDDRDAYGALKTELAGRGFTRVMDYNNHKAELVYDLYEKAFAGDPDHEHEPQPRPGSP